MKHVVGVMGGRGGGIGEIFSFFFHFGKSQITVPRRYETSCNIYKDEDSKKGLPVQLWF